MNNPIGAANFRWLYRFVVEVLWMEKIAAKGSTFI